VPSTHDLPQRKQTRLAGYDYAQLGWYYITLCTQGGACIFGSVLDGRVVYNDAGTVVETAWQRSFDLRAELTLDSWVLMPNHVHAVVVIRPTAETETRHSASLKPRSLSSFIAGFKGASARAVNNIRRTPGRPVWQRGYYEHVVRTEEALDEIRKYIMGNPLAWWYDKYNPDRIVQ
jgi:putative transposase